jgi:hypothetical protein
MPGGNGTAKMLAATRTAGVRLYRLCRRLSEKNRKTSVFGEKSFESVGFSWYFRGNCAFWVDRLSRRDRPLDGTGGKPTARPPTAEPG